MSNFYPYSRYEFTFSIIEPEPSQPIIEPTVLKELQRKYNIAFLNKNKAEMRNLKNQLKQVGY
jgi:hypothetical protein